jgi:hypothetical protein
MLDGFQYNPIVDIVATEFTFKALEPELAIHVARSLSENLGYNGLDHVAWYYVDNDGKRSLRADHIDRPLKADLNTLAEIIEQMREDTESLFEDYNKVFGTKVEFDGIGVHFGDDNELPEMD